MSRTCGIHLDRQRFRLVVLEGSAKKHRIVAHASGQAASDEDAASALAAELRRAVKEHKIKAESVGLAVDSGLAAFRTLTLPFDDRSKIEEVIKFEIENDLPQWNIDDVIVDFIVTDPSWTAPRSSTRPTPPACWPRRRRRS
jgi:Tfp pilus assembly PilM family ATPase